MPTYDPSSANVTYERKYSLIVCTRPSTPLKQPTECRHDILNQLLVSGHALRTTLYSDFKCEYPTHQHKGREDVTVVTSLKSRRDTMIPLLYNGREKFRLMFQSYDHTHHLRATTNYYQSLRLGVRYSFLRDFRRKWPLILISSSWFGSSTCWPIDTCHIH